MTNIKSNRINIIRFLLIFTFIFGVALNVQSQKDKEEQCKEIIVIVVNDEKNILENIIPCPEDRNALDGILYKTPDYSVVIDLEPEVENWMLYQFTEEKDDTEAEIDMEDWMVQEFETENNTVEQPDSIVENWMMDLNKWNITSK